MVHWIQRGRMNGVVRFNRNAGSFPSAVSELQYTVSKMRMLWVKIGGLWPPNSGGRLRSYNLIRELSIEHDVTVLTTCESGTVGNELRQRLPDCREIVEVPHRTIKHKDHGFPLVLLKSWFTGRPVDIERCRVPELAAEAREHMDSGNYDLCIADFLCALPNVTSVGTAPVVLFEHNVEYMIWKRLARTGTSLPRRLVLEAEWRRVRSYEIKACASVARTLTVSEDDRDLLRKAAPGASVFAVPTGVDVDYFSPRPEVDERNEVVFVGSMDWYPNEDAMRWFIDAVLPPLRNRIPGVVVTVVGRNPSQHFCRLAKAHGVDVTGTVDDVRSYVARAAVCMVPLRIGGGTRLKIFEGLAMGKATVTTSIGAEGLPLVGGRDVVFADQADDFARQISILLGDPIRRQQLGETGRELVTSRYAWPRVAREFASLCQAACVNAGSTIPADATGVSVSHESRRTMRPEYTES